jgi:hypothetical protein
MNGIDPIATELAHMQQKMLQYLRALAVIFGRRRNIHPAWRFGHCHTAIIYRRHHTFLGLGNWDRGGVHVSRALIFREMPGFGLWIFGGVLQIVAGGLLIADPIFGVITIIIMMTLFFKMVSEY